MNTDELNEKEMSLVEHIIDLRRCVVKIVIALGLSFALLLPFSARVYEWFARPVMQNLLPGQKMLAHQSMDILLTPWKVCLFIAVLITIPWIIYQIWSFVSPGMYRKEKRVVIPLLVSVTGLFYLGVLFAYFVILPIMFHFLVGITLQDVEYMPDINSYLGLSLKIFMAFGIVFEVPVAIVILVLMNVVEIETLTAKRSYVVLIAFVVGMILTPPDVFSQILLAVPLLILFEIGILIAKYLKKNKSA